MDGVCAWPVTDVDRGIRVHIITSKPWTIIVTGTRGAPNKGTRDRLEWRSLFAAGKTTRDFVPSRPARAHARRLSDDEFRSRRRSIGLVRRPDEIVVGDHARSVAGTIVQTIGSGPRKSVVSGYSRERNDEMIIALHASTSGRLPHSYDGIEGGS